MARRRCTRRPRDEPGGARRVRPAGTARRIELGGGRARRSRRDRLRGALPGARCRPGDRRCAAVDVRQLGAHRHPRLDLPHRVEVHRLRRRERGIPRCTGNAGRSTRVAARRRRDRLARRARRRHRDAGVGGVGAEADAPDAGFGELYGRALRIGRDHISSTVNTLFLAYAGASLPLLLLFSEAEQGLASVATREMVAVEIVRALVGSIGLVASVPISTALAAKVLASTTHATEPDPEPTSPNHPPNQRVLRLRDRVRRHPPPVDRRQPRAARSSRTAARRSAARSGRDPARRFEAGLRRRRPVRGQRRRSRGDPVGRVGSRRPHGRRCRRRLVRALPAQRRSQQPRVAVGTAGWPTRRGRDRRRRRPARDRRGDRRPFRIGPPCSVCSTTTRPVPAT
jgi:hypothetical protein